MSRLSEPEQSLISAIYDAAVDPAAWPGALELLRDRLGVAYVGLIAAEVQGDGRPVPFLMRGTAWDPVWLERLFAGSGTLPGFERMRLAPVDVPMPFRSTVGEAVFADSAFRHQWVEPQGLDDACNTPVVVRPNLTAMLTCWIARGQRALGRRDLDMLTQVSGHLRRAVLITEMLDSQRQAQRIHAALLDSLTTPILLVDAEGRVTYANPAAEGLLAQGTHLVAPHGRLRAASPAHAPALAEALRRAALERDPAMQSWGCATLLPAQGLEPAFAYVLPFGQSALRHGLGAGLAAVLIAGAGTVPPPPVEVIAAAFGLTAAEARAALAIAGGAGTAQASASLGVAPNTLRKQLAHARAAWDERRRVRAHWPVVRRIARDLALGRRRLEVRIEDAHASALCSVGIEGFLRRIGLGRVRRVSGRTAALLMALEPQVGFVILAAYERAHGRLPDPAARNDDTRGLRLA